MASFVRRILATVWATEKGYMPEVAKAKTKVTSGIGFCIDHSTLTYFMRRQSPPRAVSLSARSRSNSSAAGWPDSAAS